jgi:hypothetical protein
LSELKHWSGRGRIVRSGGADGTPENKKATSVDVALLAAVFWRPDLDSNQGPADNSQSFKLF